MSDICFSIFISFFFLPEKERDRNRTLLYKDTKTVKRNIVIISPHHPTYIHEKLKGMTN